MSTEDLIELCDGRVWHQRLRPFKHPLNYSVFCLRLRMDRSDDLARRTNWLFGFNKRRPISFMNQDHGHRDGADLRVWLDEVLREAAVPNPGAAVWLQTFPRVLGYVFNPVSFWYLYDHHGELQVIVAEVNNTFGQHHQYVLTALNGRGIDSQTTLSCQKVFHVSPFCPVKGHYQFQRVVSAHGDRMSIDYYDDSSLPEPLLKTGISVRPEPFTTAALFKRFLRMPFMTIAVMARIHWHALKLWRAGAVFYKLPELPAQEVTSNHKDA